MNAYIEIHSKDFTMQLKENILFLFIEKETSFYFRHNTLTYTHTHARLVF